MIENFCGHLECQAYYKCRFNDSLHGGGALGRNEAPSFWVEAKYRQHPGSDHEPAGPTEEDPDVIEKIPESADQDAALDTLVSRASIPNLGALIKQGIKQGLIAPTTSYR